MRLIILPFAAAAALAACGESSAPVAPEPAPEASAPAEPAPTTPGAEMPAPDTPSDACGAAGRQDWTGRARDDLPAAPPGAVWRIYETGQPVTQDLRPDRLNIEIDPGSQTVVRLTCG